MCILNVNSEKKIFFALANTDLFTQQHRVIAVSLLGTYTGLRASNMLCSDSNCDGHASFEDGTLYYKAWTGGARPIFNQHGGSEPPVIYPHLPTSEWHDGPLTASYFCMYFCL